MSPNAWRGQQAIIEIEHNATSLAVGSLTDVEVQAPEQEVQEGRGSGSTEWFDLMKTETAVAVTGTVEEWDVEAFATLIDYDEAENKLDDSAEVRVFTITPQLTAADGTEFHPKVVEAYIDGSVGLSGDRESWVGMDLTFRGRTMEDVAEVAE